MLFKSKNNDQKLPNGELIGGYLAMKGIINKIGKYLGDKLLKTFPYIGPFPLFIVPLGQNLYDKINNNNGNYIAFNKCSLYYENSNCHYSQGCRCYCGHCCRCCTCDHNNINDPNLPFGAIGDKLKDWIKDFYNPFGNNEPIQSGLGSINGNKGIYDCFFKDKNGYGFKFQMNCEQVPFPKNVSPKNGKVDIFEELKGNKTKIKPFSNLFKGLVNNDPDKNLKKKMKNRKYNNDDEEYKPSLKEIKEIEKEDEDNDIKNLKKKEQKKIMIMKNINHH